jgi:preprotein translocase subunit SecB
MASSTNGGSAEEPGAEPNLGVIAQYIKDFSFENPNAPHSLMQQQQQPQISIQINVNPNQLSNTDFEVELKAELAEKVLFAFDLNYGGVFRLSNIPQENIGPLLMIECPRLLFPFARELIASAISNGGFPPLMLQPIDFVGLYQRRLADTQGQQAPTTA